MLHSTILLTFIKLSFVIKTFVLSIFKWPLKTGVFCTLRILRVVSRMKICFWSIDSLCFVSYPTDVDGGGTFGLDSVGICVVTGLLHGIVTPKPPNAT